MSFRKYECESCGLIYRVQMLNLVENHDDSILGNHCPNCGSTEVSEDGE